MYARSDFLSCVCATVRLIVGCLSSYVSSLAARQDFGVQSVVDAPCGDLAWMQEVDLQGAQYLGVDIVPQLIADNQRRFVSRPDMSFRVLDIVRETPPAADLIFCRETLQHLTQGDALRALINFSNSGARCVQHALSASRSS